MHKLQSIFLLTTLLFSTCLTAQINRSNTKKSVPYRANYQRMSCFIEGKSAYELRGGKLFAWGSNLFGQLGDGTTINKTHPAQIGIDSNWISIDAGYEHVIALKSDGTIWGAGQNSSGELGVNSTSNDSIFQQIGSDNDWTVIASGFAISFGIKSNGTLWAWGNNQSGALGLGTSGTNQSVPAQIGTDSDWSQLSVSFDHVIALKSNGSLWGWGKNNYGQLGTGTIVSENSPIQIGSDNDWVLITTGTHCSAALKSNGTLWSWGDNSNGKLGLGSIVSQLTPLQAGTDNTWVSYSMGCTSSMGIKSDGTLWGCGTLYDASLGDITSTTTSIHSISVQIGTENNWVGINCGDLTMALKSDGSLWDWGWNFVGQIGNGTLTTQYYPLLISVQNDCIKVANAVVRTTCTLTSTGELVNYGSLNYVSPGDKNWISISTGWNHHVGIKSNGTLWAWGLSNSHAEMETVSMTPVQIGAESNWVSTSVRTYHTLALKTDGTLWAWGYNQFGALGDGTTIWRTSVGQIGVATDWVSAAAGHEHSLGLKSDGSIWAWGTNLEGQLGDGTHIEKHTPIKVGISNDWIAIAAGNTHSIGLKSNGTLWAWGSNDFGQLGDGTTISKNVPVQIGTGNNWITISAGDGSSMALKSDGTLWTWGKNSEGQLGDGTNTNKNSPTQIDSENTWVAITGATRNSFGIKADRGRICGTGENQEGELCDGTIIPSNIFICDTRNAGMDELFQEVSSVKIYPNPNVGNFTFESEEDGVFLLFNELGVTIQTIELNHTNDRKIEITNLENGIYFIISQNEETFSRQKIIVLK